MTHGGAPRTCSGGDARQRGHVPRLSRCLLLLLLCHASTAAVHAQSATSALQITSASPSVITAGGNITLGIQVAGATSISVELLDQQGQHVATYLSDGGAVLQTGENMVVVGLVPGTWADGTAYVYVASGSANAQYEITISNPCAKCVSGDVGVRCKDSQRGNVEGVERLLRAGLPSWRGGVFVMSASGSRCSLHSSAAAVEACTAQ